MSCNRCDLAPPKPKMAGGSSLLAAAGSVKGFHSYRYIDMEDGGATAAEEEDDGGGLRFVLFR